MLAFLQTFTKRSSKKVIIITCISLFFFARCSIYKNKPIHTKSMYNSPFHVEKEAFRLIDSLSFMGQDTSLLILTKCYNCIYGSSTPGYILYKKNNVFFLIKLDNYQVYYFPDRINYSELELYFQTKFQMIDTTKVLLSDFGYHNLILHSIGQNRVRYFTYREPRFDKNYTFIYYIESMILNYMSSNIRFPVRRPLK